MRHDDDTIAAIATPPGQGAIALLRLSGPRANAIAADVFRRGEKSDRADLAAREATFGRIIDRAGMIIDHGVATRFTAPASFTGEDVVEFGCHGGVLVTRRILDRLIEAGARSAEPGEFTQRAFLNGKIDLTQAEAVMDVISAQTSLALRSAAEQLEGRLGSELCRSRDDLIAAIAHLEAYIDFPDEDIDPDTGAELRARLSDVRSRLARLIATADRGRFLREGVRTVICGAPNVGKSSLLNFLLGFDRAIVSESAGTTRDTIEETLSIAGFPIRLVDTAGLRETADAVESAGIARTRQQLESADLVLEVVDASQPPDQPRPEPAPGPKWIAVLNKADLGLHPDWPKHLSADRSRVTISCLRGEGRHELEAAIQHALSRSESPVPENTAAIAINARHHACLQRASGAIADAIAAMDAASPPEFTAIDLREALDAIGDILGKIDADDILDEIFSSFCIGK